MVRCKAERVLRLTDTTIDSGSIAKYSLEVEQFRVRYFVFDSSRSYDNVCFMYYSHLRISLFARNCLPKAHESIQGVKCGSVMTMYGDLYDESCQQEPYHDGLHVWC